MRDRGMGAKQAVHRRKESEGRGTALGKEEEGW